MIYLPYAALLAAFALIHLPRMIVGREMGKMPGGYNNREPRAQQAELSGIGRRALGAHQNAFEAFAPFAVGVFAALSRGVRVDTVAWISVVFVALRTGYMFAYINDKSTLRSGLWTLSTLSIASLMVLAIIGGSH